MKRIIIISLITVVVAVAVTHFGLTKAQKEEQNVGILEPPFGLTQDFSLNDVENGSVSLKQMAGVTPSGNHDDTDHAKPSLYTPELRRQLFEVRKKTDPVFVTRAKEAYEALVSKEKKDVQWQKEVADRIEMMLDSPNFEGTSVEEVDCGQRICKAAFSYRDFVAFDMFEENKVKDPNIPWAHMEAFFEVESDENGKQHQTVFFSRDKYDLTFHLRAHEEVSNTIQ